MDVYKRDLEWHLALLPGLATQVTLFDLECFPRHPVAAGEGGDEAEARFALWTLTGQDDPADAVAVVAEVYSRRTGRPPDQG